MVDLNAKIPNAPNFTWRELFRSATAESKRINNTTNDSGIIASLNYLAEKILQPARNHFGKPMRITSGYRSPALNKAIGGSATSFHSHGCAVDCEIPGIPNMDLFTFFYRQGLATELIAEECAVNDPNAGWIHVAVMKGREREMQTKYKLPGNNPVRRASFAEICKIFHYTPKD